MGIMFFGPGHEFSGHVDHNLDQFDSSNVHLGGTEVHAQVGYHFDHSHQLLGTTEHHPDGSSVDYDHGHRIVGTTEHHGGIAYHYDAAHGVIGTQQEFGGHTYSYDASHQLVGTSEGGPHHGLQADLASAFRRLF